MTDAEEARNYVRHSFQHEYKKNAATAMVNLMCVVDDLIAAKQKLEGEKKELERQQDRVFFRVAFVACRQLLDRVAEVVKAAHKGKGRLICGGVAVPLGTTTEALDHLAQCTQINTRLQTLLQKPTNGRMEAGTARDIFSQTSDLLHNAIFTDEQILLVPSALFPQEIDLMVTLAANYHLRVKVVNSDGIDLTNRILTAEQFKLLSNV